MSSIEEAFRARLVALGTAAEDSIYREVIEQEPEKTPVISFIRTGGASMRRILDTGKPCLQRATIRVEILTDDLTQLGTIDTIAEQLKAGLDGWRGDSAGVEILRCACLFQGDASLPDGDLFLKIIQQDYDLVFR